jgi:lipid II:glycine glycyltransferase (peptidoglycan interpeptide bridge formation enzyme)
MRTASLATVVLDLGPDEDVLLSRMKPKTRYNVQLSQRKGIRVREGTAADLPVFQQMLEQTARRQKFSPNSALQLANMCRILSPAGQFKLFIAEYEGQAVSGLLAVPFRDTVIYKRGAWSGQHGSRRPNEALHWAAIQWAKRQGFRYYDFDGIQARTAKRIVKGEPLPDSMLQSVTRFKLGFGGRVVLLPGSYSYICHPLLRWGCQRTFPLIAKSRVLARTLKWVRAH